MMPIYVPASIGQFLLWALALLLLGFGLLFVGASALAPSVDAQHGLFARRERIVKEVLKRDPDDPWHRFYMGALIPLLIVVVGFLYAILLWRA
ncbi:hypothetical protein WQQ_43980 [Hydrocarboniphaga effusa AP103]|uniref:Uncharacterized protein n=2 Tax=Nevskiaceae TaxID=568386 RepID=I8T2T2_9GAMM|nr:hypothetical protein WQQ_43980 [Hydrocarboniphaga effusa AP103]